ncbi:hypothetical protein D1818_07020 [Aquimarina sp. BL5]|uniref:RDD family protein n=1 Tax=Aquimarina sp. BL5 TaxID=1714860 RepID=UPI000E5106BE|nr:RDD family protein [Aquimarina sp. BL5]AXT50595.1 hypothetical protein D1818_07020 [Aquimarina sp. BL5]RKM97708.1 hypothetical protein D7036_20380 [Aquimarina sp. BL5]
MTESNTNSDGIIIEEISKINNINPRINRVLSMLLDHFIMCLLIVPLGILIGVLAFQFGQNFNKLTGIGLFSIPMFVYFNKDFLRAKSLAKRLMGYQIIDVKTNKPANELQCFIRNLTIIVWPIEVVVGLINPKRRVGDFIANTKVINSKKEKPKTVWSDLKNVKLKVNFIGIIIIGGFYFYGLSLIFPGMN